MRNIDSLGHVTGESQYVDDIPVREGCLHAAVLASTIARGEITRLDVSAARAEPGVVCVLTADEIPGENQIGGILPDEFLLAESEVDFCGQPLALVVAHTEAAARAARAAIQVEYREAEPVVDPRDAHARQDFHVPPRTFELGRPEDAWAECAHVFEGRVDIGGQEHLYIETQGAYAFTTENGDLQITSSTQGPTAVQRTTARVLGIPMHRVVVDVRRLGGGFGGKEDQATAWAVLAALAAQVTGRPVKLILHRLDDMAMTGKRHPYSADYRIGLNADLGIHCYQATFYQNAGAAADLSPAVLERTLFHATNSYRVPNVRATAFCCRTNLPPFTAFRGFGGPQAMFVIEAAITRASESLGIPAADIQAANLLADGDEFPYGQTVRDCRARAAWDLMSEGYDLAAGQREVAAYNAANVLTKRGLACMPICFGISFTNTSMNQARALVHVYQDGSVGVSTGAVEMGQGVNTKMVQVAADVFGIDPTRIKIETTNTTRIANTSPSAASATADLNGKALILACTRVRDRLLQVEVAGEPTFEQRVRAAYLARVSLSEHAHYATPEIHFDTGQEKGHPFAYHVYGSAIITAQLDCLRGTYRIEKFEVVHDCGANTHPIVDLGQIEGGIVQGMGWMTCEDLVFSPDGRLLSDALSTYKIPDLFSAPTIELTILPADPHPHALLGSKAVGEPPLMYGIGAYFAIRAAIRAFRPDAPLEFISPLTPERVLMALHG